MVLKDIFKCVENKAAVLNRVGLSDGVLGLALFYYYAYLYSNEEIYKEMIIPCIEHAITNLNATYQTDEIDLEIIEIGEFLMFLVTKELIAAEEVEYILLELDELIEQFLLKSIAQRDLDYTAGSLKAGVYFIHRNTKEYLCYALLECIEQLAVSKNEFIYWNFDLDNSKHFKPHLGLGHGLCGVVSYLLQLYQKDFERNRCRNLVNKSILFLLMQEDDMQKTNWFNISAFKSENLYYHNLSYGDLGIGYVLYKAGVILEDQEYCIRAHNIFENCASFRDDTARYIHDANLIYGAAGLCAVFDEVSRFYNSAKIEEAKEYWYKKISQFRCESDKNIKWAGFSTYFNREFDYAQLGFSQGIIGIGIVLMAREMNLNNDYLHFLNYDL